MGEKLASAQERMWTTLVRKDVNDNRRDGEEKGFLRQRGSEFFFWVEEEQTRFPLR